LNFLDRFSKKNIQISDLMKIRPVGAELFRADRRTDMTKIIVAFLNDASTPKDANTIVQCGYKTRVDLQNSISTNTAR
jgi:hypothetical protein